MLDLGTSFLASVARDPDALAIVDGDMRLTYRAMVRAHLRACRAASTELGLKPGDHLVTVLQNRWEAATMHWACQFAGIIITPLNWRVDRRRTRFLPRERRSQGAGLRGRLRRGGAGIARSAASCAADRRRAAAQRSDIASTLARRERSAAMPQPRAGADAWSVMLYTSGTTARPKGVPRRQRAERAAALAHVAQNLYAQRRAHARRHAALSHHGRALAAGDVADRRRLRLPAALRCGARAGADRSREDHQPLSGADALSRPRASPTLRRRPTSARCASSALPAPR